MTDDKTASSPASDLIGMADIAQMAGQSRATVGNWKRRYPDDFPKQRGSSPRGPLYDAAEVVTWLASQTRTSAERSEVATAAFEMADAMGSEVAMHDQLPLILALLSAGRDIALGSRISYLDLVGALAQVLELRGGRCSRSQRAQPGRPPCRTAGCDCEAESNRTRRWTTSQISWIGSAWGSVSMTRLSESPGSWPPWRVPVTPSMTPALASGRSSPPACGREARRKGECVAGQEISSVVALCARLVFRMLGIPVDIIVADSLARDVRPGTTYERVVADLPMGQRLLPDTLSQGDPRWTFEDPGVTSASPAWIQECLYHLAPSGRAVLLVTPVGTVCAGANRSSAPKVDSRRSARRRCGATARLAYSHLTPFGIAHLSSGPTSTRIGRAGPCPHR